MAFDSDNIAANVDDDGNGYARKQVGGQTPGRTYLKKAMIDTSMDENKNPLKKKYMVKPAQKRATKRP